MNDFDDDGYVVNPSKKGSWAGEKECSICSTYIQYTRDMCIVCEQAWIVGYKAALDEIRQESSLR